MAFYINILKTDQVNDEYVYYIYKFSMPGQEYKSASGKTRYELKEVSGRLKIDKKNGEVHTIELAEGDDGIYVKRASWALIKHWKDGDFPEKTCWIS